MTNNSTKLWHLPHHSEGWEWSVGSLERRLSRGRTDTHALPMFHFPRAVPPWPVNLLYPCTSFNLGFVIVTPLGSGWHSYELSALPSAGDCQHPLTVKSLKNFRHFPQIWSMDEHSWDLLLLTNLCQHLAGKASARKQKQAFVPLLEEHGLPPRRKPHLRLWNSVSKSSCWSLSPKQCIVVSHVFSIIF